MAKNYAEDETILAAFISFHRITDIAKATGLSRRTIYKIKANKRFQDALQEHKSAVLTAAVNRMREFLAEDVGILQEIIKNPDTPAQTKVYAFQTMSNALKDWLTITDLNKRLDDLVASVATGAHIGSI